MPDLLRLAVVVYLYIVVGGGELEVLIVEGVGGPTLHGRLSDTLVYSRLQAHLQGKNTS